MSLLQVNHVHHCYFSKTAATEVLRNVEFSIYEGEFISFLGPSGCGKTTLLSIIAGLLAPTEGAVLLEGKDIANSAQSSIGYMLQQDYLFPWKTIEENVMLGLKLKKHNEDNAQFIARNLLNDVGLINVEEKYPRELSGGMRQRVALARTLAVNPKILLLDEPFSALDYQSKLKLENLVSSTLKQYGKTAVLVTHDIGEAIAMSDRILLFSARPGKLHQIFEVPKELLQLTPFEVRSHPLYSELFQTIWKELEQLASPS